MLHYLYQPQSHMEKGLQSISRSSTEAIINFFSR